MVSSIQFYFSKIPNSNIQISNKSQKAIIQIPIFKFKSLKIQIFENLVLFDICKLFFGA